MKTNIKGRPAFNKHLAAKSADVQRMLDCKNPSKQCGPLPLQQPVFLGGLPDIGEVYEPQTPTGKKLKKIIDSHYYEAAFETAIKFVARQNIPELRRIRNLYQFYFYIDTLVRWIPEIRVWCWYGDTLHERTVYTRIVQFYYYFNQPTLEALQSPIEPDSREKLSPISLWLRDFAVEWGAFLDTPASAEYLESFMFAPEYSWQEFEKKPTEYKTFNDFFARTFKDISVQRPVASESDESVITFPAESTFVGQWAISTPVGAPMPAGASITVKHIQWPIAELLADTQFANDFEGGLLCHSFLNTYDYHRLHTCVGGDVLEAKFIAGQVYLDVALEKQLPDAPEDEVESGDLANAVVPRRFLDADDPTGYQFVQCRGLIVLQTKTMGKVAILPIGMAQVSSVVFVDPDENPIELSAQEKKELNYQEQVDSINKKLKDELVGKHYSKGQMFSYFQFGGSDCVVLFERKANVNVTAVKGRHYPLRSQYAVANGNG